MTLSQSHCCASFSWVLDDRGDVDENTVTGFPPPSSKWQKTRALIRSTTLLRRAIEDAIVVVQGMKIPLVPECWTHEYFAVVVQVKSKRKKSRQWMPLTQKRYSKTTLQNGAQTRIHQIKSWADNQTNPQAKIQNFNFLGTSHITKQQQSINHLVGRHPRTPLTTTSL